MEQFIVWCNYVILSAAETWIGYRLLNTYLTRRADGKKWYFFSIICYFIFQMLSYIYMSPIFSMAVWYFLFSLVISVIFFTDSLQNKVTIALLFVIMNYASKTAVTAIGITLGLQSLHLEYESYRLVMDPWAQMAACLLFMLLLWGTIYIRRLRLKRQNLLYSAISYIFPLIIMMQAVLLSKEDVYFDNDTVSHVCLFYSYTSVLLFSASIGLFYLLEKNILLDITSEKSLIMEELLSLQRRHYERMEVSQRETRALRHDIKKHIHSLYVLLEKEHIEEAKEYICNLDSQNRRLKGITYSGNIVIDAILSNSFANVQNSDIDIKCSVIVPPVLEHIEDVDLCVIFGNLVDNAIEACQRMNDTDMKSIILNVNVRKDYLFIDISNSFTGEVNKQNNIYKTVKVNERYCGIGLFNIEKVVHKYNGELAIKHSDNIFNVSVILSLLPEVNSM